MSDRLAARDSPVGYGWASLGEDGLWVVWHPGYSASRRRWRFERAPIALGTLVATGVLVGGEWFAITSTNLIVHAGGPFIAPVLAVVLFMFGRAMAFDPVGDAAYFAPGHERLRHGRRCFAEADFSDAARAGAKPIIEALHALYQSRAANEGWLDEHLLHNAHRTVWEALQRLASGEDLRSAIEDARRHPELSASVRQRQRELAAIDTDIRTVSVRMVEAAQQARHLDNRLNAMDARTRREADRERARARLDGTQAPRPNDPVSTELGQEAVEAVRARIQAAQEVLMISEPPNSGGDRANGRFPG